MQERPSRVVFSPMNVIAGVSALALMGALIWSTLHRSPSQTPIFARAAAGSDTTVLGDTAGLDELALATSSTPLGDAILDQFASRYIAISQSGVASTSAAQIAADIVPNMPLKEFAEADIPSDPDTSLQRVLQYRNDLRIALEPLLSDTTPELEIYARWIDTGDAQYLTRLSAIAANYDAAIAAAARIRTPRDAVHYQVGILNAMGHFSAALRALSTNAHDPIASVSLLRTYNMAEQEMFTAFNSLALYAAQKATP